MSGINFKRLRARFWRSRSATITETDETYRVTYLGNVLTGWAKGEGCVDKPLSTLWRNHVGSEKPNIMMKVTVVHCGLRAVTKEHGLTEYWANRITFCGTDPAYPKIFCWIYRHEGRKLKQELRCHAVLCSSQSKAQLMAQKLKDRLHQALVDFKKDKLNRQAARLSVASSLDSNPNMPYRKFLLQVGSSNYRPPVERSKSAPKLKVIEEEDDYYEESVSDSSSSSSSSDNIQQSSVIQESSLPSSSSSTSSNPQLSDGFVTSTSTVTVSNSPEITTNPSIHIHPSYPIGSIDNDSSSSSSSDDEVTDYLEEEDEDIMLMDSASASPDSNIFSTRSSSVIEGLVSNLRLGNGNGGNKADSDAISDESGYSEDSAAAAAAAAAAAVAAAAAEVAVAVTNVGDPAKSLLVLDTSNKCDTRNEDDDNDDVIKDDLTVQGVTIKDYLKGRTPIKSTTIQLDGLVPEFSIDI